MQARNTTQCPRMPDIIEGLSAPVAHACIPLRFDETTRGVLNVAARPGQLFTEDELRFLETLGHQIGLAVERARHLDDRAPPQPGSTCHGGGEQGGRRSAGRRGRPPRGGRDRARDRERRSRGDPAGRHAGVDPRRLRRRAGPSGIRGRPHARPDHGRLAAGHGRPRRPPGLQRRRLAERSAREPRAGRAMGHPVRPHRAADRARAPARPAPPELRGRPSLERRRRGRGGGAGRPGLRRPGERAPLRGGAAGLSAAPGSAGAQLAQREDGRPRHLRVRARPRGAQPAQLDRPPALHPRPPDRPLRARRWARRWPSCPASSATR